MYSRINTHTDIRTQANLHLEGPNEYRENLTKAPMRNWAILTALIHQQTMMQSKVKCALLFFALTELKTFFRIFTHTVF